MRFIAKKTSLEGNVSKRDPLANFAYLLATVVILTALIFVALGYVASYLVVQISPATEAKIGQMLVQVTIEDELKDDRRIDYLEELLNSLLMADETVRLPLTIHLLDSEIINAAIMPGGHMLIHTALLEEMESENELALILAHELGHFQTRDPLKSLGRSLVFMVVSIFLDFSTAESGGISQIVPITSSLTELSYSRKQETAADLYGLTRIINLYGHGGYSLDFFKELASEEEHNLITISKYFLTHPRSQERIEELNIEAIKNGWNMTGVITYLPPLLYCPNMEVCD